MLTLEEEERASFAAGKFSHETGMRTAEGCQLCPAGTWSGTPSDEWFFDMLNADCKSASCGNSSCCPTALGLTSAEEVQKNCTKLAPDDEDDVDDDDAQGEHKDNRLEAALAGCGGAAVLAAVAAAVVWRRRSRANKRGGGNIAPTRHISESKYIFKPKRSSLAPPAKDRDRLAGSFEIPVQYKGKRGAGVARATPEAGKLRASSLGARAESIGASQISSKLAKADPDCAPSAPPAPPAATSSAGVGTWQTAIPTAVGVSEQSFRKLVTAAPVAVAAPYEGGGGGGGGGDLGTDLASQIERLVRLQESGVLSDEEMRRAKAKLLR